MLYFCLINDVIGRKMKKGFTLTELLVVVLIIGILAAVALPQYQVAVLKSRYMQAVVTATALRRAQDIYYMANGEYATDITVLDVDLPGCVADEDRRGCLADTYYCVVGSTRESGSIKGVANCQLKGDPLLIYSASPTLPVPICMAAQDSKAANRVCVSMGGEYRSNNNGHNNYYFY